MSTGLSNYDLLHPKMSDGDVAMIWMISMLLSAILIGGGVYAILNRNKNSWLMPAGIGGIVGGVLIPVFTYIGLNS